MRVLLSSVILGLYCLTASARRTVEVKRACSSGGDAGNGAGEKGEVTYSNANRFLFDVDGNHIDAYATKINYFEGKYFLRGISFGGQGGLNTWSSVDLTNWKFEGNQNFTNPGRPHTIFNPQTNKYVLWFDDGMGYTVVESRVPAGGFGSPVKAAIDPQFAGLQPADLAVESFGDKGYLVFSALNFRDPRAGSLWPPVFQTMHISELTSDFKSTTQTSFNVTSAAFDLVDQSAESPDLFIRNGTFYISASNTCGFCSGSIGVLYRANFIEGPWDRQVLAEYSCGGQVEGVLPLTDPDTGLTSYVWHSTTTPGGPRIAFSGHIFQPLQFNDDGSVKPLDCADPATFTIPFTRGQGDVATGKFTQATDKAPMMADYKAVCDTDLYLGVHQTWQNTKSGVLSDVSVNIAAGGQKSPLQINVYRFSNLDELVAPEYKFDLLGTKQFNATDLTEAFGLASVPLNATVAEGDMLGFSIGEAAFAGFITGNFVPYCHLEYNLTTTEAQVSGLVEPVMLEQASGQNSPRGFRGEISAVKRREGKGMRFFATVN